jgi:hypothetical protein
MLLVVRLRRLVAERSTWRITKRPSNMQHLAQLQQSMLGVFLLKIACKISRFVPKKWQLMASAMVPVPLLL